MGGELTLCAMHSSSAQSGVRALSCKRVLIVEDDADSAELLGLMLESVGYQVCIAHSIAAALAIAPVLQPHVALIDLGLPDGNGCELLASLKADRLLRACRFIATTGYGDSETVSRSLALGFDEHLTKPLERASVLAATRGAEGDGDAYLATKP